MFICATFIKYSYLYKPNGWAQNLYLQRAYKYKKEKHRRIFCISEAQWKNGGRLTSHHIQGIHTIDNDIFFFVRV